MSTVESLSRLNPASLSYAFMEERITSVHHEFSPKMQQISRVCEIADSEIFTDPHLKKKQLTILSDYDAVWMNPWHPKLSHTDLSVLQKLATRADRFIIESARLPFPDGSASSPFVRDFFMTMPFFSTYWQERITTFLTRYNPNCIVNFYCGVSKLIPGEQFPAIEEIIEDSIQGDGLVVEVASSIFDRLRLAKRTTKLKKRDVWDLRKFYYFDLGHLFI